MISIQKPVIPGRVMSLDDEASRRDDFSTEAGRLNASSLQTLIDRTSASGGGRVVVPSGFWAMAPIKLKSHVDLHLADGCCLKFIKSKEDYPLVVTDYEGMSAIRTVSPVSADHAEDIAISGNGIIDGSGDLWRPVKQFKVTERQWNELLQKGGRVVEGKERAWMPTDSSWQGLEHNLQGTDEKTLRDAAPYWDFYRPVMVDLKHCRRVALSGVTFTNSPAWCIHPFFCEDVLVYSIQVKNPYWAQNGDGIDVESCRRVEIGHSTFETGDDAICVKSGKNAEARRIEGPSEAMYIHDCTVFHGHGGFVVGSEMSRGVRDILVERCLFVGTDVGVRFKSALGRGGVVQNIELRDIRMVDIKHEAIILTMGYALNTIGRTERNVMETEDDIPVFRDITMSGMRFLGQQVKVKIEPVPGRPETISHVVINGKRYDGQALVR